MKGLTKLRKRTARARVGRGHAWLARAVAAGLQLRGEMQSGNGTWQEGGAGRAMQHPPMRHGGNGAQSRGAQSRGAEVGGGREGRGCS